MKPNSKIAELRDQAGLTQRELALLLGVTETTVANWERGRSGLEWIDRVIRLCKALNCNLEDLIEYEADQTEPTFAELRHLYNVGKILPVIPHQP
jgi:transcriptional regulator with XRE-family HTH domain